MSSKCTDKKMAQASMENLYRIFSASEEPGSTLARIDQEISDNMLEFLSNNIVANDKEISELEQNFSDSLIPDNPVFVSEQTEFLLEKLVAESVHTAAPGYVGHMTSAFPYFMLPLSKIMIALNQNVVKTETSKAFTPLERQVIAMLHRLVFNNQESFYREHMHISQEALGAFCSGGTIANLTALWVARNHQFKATAEFKGIRQLGMAASLRHYGYRGAALVVSERGHYSLTKAADLLGVGRDHLVAIETDNRHRVDIKKLESKLKKLAHDNIKVISLIGVAGTTETGSIDPLEELAKIAGEYDCHYHVDAAWGGPTLFSQKHKHLLAGIEKADSVTIDAHKQLYVPIGAGLVVFRVPEVTSEIVQHANYIIREGSKDLGTMSVEGSRNGMAMLVHSGLRIIGRKGYELLIDGGIDKARKFALMIEEHPEFELLTRPELNILTYRYVPMGMTPKLTTLKGPALVDLNEKLNRLNQRLQKTQREKGNSFVSRTRLRIDKYAGQELQVLRVVLANPLTTIDTLQDVLNEQGDIVRTEGLALEAE